MSEDQPQWIIWSNEHRAWWRPGRMGYTTLTHEAGRYHKIDATRIIEQSNAAPRRAIPNEVMVLAPLPETATDVINRILEKSLKVLWEEKDMEVGRIIQKHDCGLSGKWMICWLSNGEGHQFGVVSLADGMVSLTGTKAALAEKLNKASHYLPAEVMHHRFTIELPAKARRET